MKKNKNQKTQLGQSLIESLQDALAFEKGTKKSLKTNLVEIPDEPPAWKPKDVVRLRKYLNLSQPLFARCLGVSDATIRAWEQGLKHPNGAANRLLQVISFQPKILSALAGR